jgi:hypothetical protein
MVDLSSALVLEKRNSRIPANKPEGKGAKAPLDSHIRVCKPGVNIIQPGELLQGVADLRPQARKNLGVTVKTRDGIELTTDVFTLFTIGEKPEVLIVTFLDDSHENVRAIELSEVWTGAGPSGKMSRVVKEYLPEDEIDPQDRTEIVHFYTRWKSANLAEISPGTARQIENDFSASPFFCDPERVSAAVYSQAKTSAESQVMHWTELPAVIATEILRDSISKVFFDDLYLPDDPQQFPLRQFKEMFSKKVRNQGVLSFRVVERADGKRIEPGHIWDEAELILSPIQNFRRSKILRDRGIKVISAGFTQLEPDQAVRQQILDYWKVRWEKQLELIETENELEAMRIKNRARVKTQKELAILFSNIIESSDPQSRDKLFQLLEATATDPATRKLLPRETINILWNLRKLLLPEDNQQNLDPLH